MMPTRTRLWSWGPVCLWAGMIFVSSSMPVPPEAQALLLHGMDKVMHGFEYGILSYLVARAFRRTAPGWSPLCIAVWAVLLSSLYGVSDEVHQAFVPTRTADPLDALADAAGAVVAQLVLTYRPWP